MKKLYSIILFHFVCTIANAQGTWLQKANFGGITRYQAVGFSIGAKGYIGTGSDVSGNHLLDFWEWDQSTNVWTQKADFGGIRRQDAVGFSIGTKGYIGTASGNTSDDFWEWDQATNIWTQKANFGGTARQSAVGFSIGTKGYIGTGGNGGSPTETYYVDFWEWDQATNVWTQKANFGGAARIGAVGFSIAGKGYIGTGSYTYNANTYAMYDFWEWDQASNIWTQKADFAGNPRWGAVGFSIGHKGYIGTGANTQYNFLGDVWVWDQTSNTWSQIANFGLPTRRSYAVGFSINNHGYIGIGEEQQGVNFIFPQDLWEYTQGCPLITNSVTIVSPVCGNNNGSVSIITSGGTSPYTFLWSNGNTTSAISGLSGQPVDSFTVNVTDANLCSSTNSATVDCNNWTNVNFSSNLDALLDIYFLDANTGFICGWANGTSNLYNRIYSTTNGGASWTKVFEVADPPSPSSKSHSLHNIFFTSPSIGFCVGGRDGTYPFICKTINGGVTWDTLSLTSFGSPIDKIFFPSSNVGYICGAVGTGGTTLIKTIDGGTTWSDISSIASTAMSGNEISGIQFLDDTNGFACTLASSAAAGIYKTTNGGSTWTQIFTIGNNDGFHALQFISNTTGFAAATTGHVFKTTNGGTTWTPIPVSAIQTDIWDVYFYTPQLGYAASNDGYLSGGIYKTTNGGSSWTLDNSGNYVITTTYYALSFKGTRAYACGVGGYSWKDTTATTGVFESNINISNINIYPNPTSGNFIFNSQLSKGELEIYNVMGECINRQIIKSPNQQIDLSFAPNGIYFLQFKTEQGVATKKLVINK